MKISKCFLVLCFTPVFILGRVDAARYEGSGNCSSSSSTTPCVPNEEFCGTNNECIPYSCQNWYLFGPPEYTGHDGGSPILILPDEGQADQFVPDGNFSTSSEPASLECKADNDERSTGIIYGCSKWMCSGDGCTGYDTPGYGNTGIDKEFTRRCEATNGQNRYVCYDLVGATDDLQSFRSAAETFELICTWNNYDHNSTDFSSTDFNSTDPVYIYQVTLERPGVIDMAGQSSATFNDSLVEIAMHSYVEQVVAESGGNENSSGGHHLADMVGLWTITATTTTTMIGVFFLLECFV